MTTNFADQLREVGLRVTEPRLATLQQIEEGGHVSADELRTGVAKKLGSVSTQEIYDIVHALTDKGLRREVKPAGHVSLFELSRNDNHHHLICRTCGRIEDVPCAVGFAPCLQPSDNHGFVIDEAEVHFWGICPQCREGSSL